MFAAASAFALFVAVLPGTSTASAVVSGSVSGAVFDDVGVDHRFADPVRWLVEGGITTGVTPSSFAPGQPVSRGQMAAFLWRYLGSPEPTGSVSFEDVGVDAWNASAVAYLNEQGIAQGVSATHFAGAREVTRQQMATFLWRLEGRPAPTSGHGFLDVPAGAAATDAIAWLVEAGITQGVSATAFDPGGAVTRGQMAAFLWRLAGQPDVPRVMHRVFELDHRSEPPGPTGFWWGGVGYPEVAQSVVLEEGFELTSIGLGLMRYDVQEGWMDQDTMNFVSGHTPIYEGYLVDATVTVSIWRGDATAFGDTVDVEDLVALTQQTIELDIPVAGWSLGPNAELELPEPVELEAGHHLISLFLEMGDRDVMTTYIWGRQSGDNTLGGPSHDLPGTCDYPRAEDRYPQGRAYSRPMVGEGGPPYSPEDAGDTFWPHTAKVMQYFDGCPSGSPDVNNPGDIELVLSGRVRS